MNVPLLEARGLAKRFGGVATLRDGTCRLMPGTVHALCGGNGAGKSTFLSLVMGIRRRDAGTLLRRGSPVDFAGPIEALRAGISIIEQELSPVEPRRCLGRDPARDRGACQAGRSRRSGDGRAAAHPHHSIFSSEVVTWACLPSPALTGIPAATRSGWSAASRVCCKAP